MKKRAIVYYIVTVLIFKFLGVNIYAENDYWINVPKENSLDDQLSNEYGRICMDGLDQDEFPIFVEFYNKSYHSDEIINIKFTIPEKGKKPELNFNVNGFSTVSDILSTDNRIFEIQLKYNGITDSPIFTLSVNIDGKEIDASIYGYYMDNTLFLSQSDTSDAVRKAYANKLFLKEISEIEFQIIMANYYKYGNTSHGSNLNANINDNVDYIESPSFGTVTSNSNYIINGVWTWEDDTGILHPLRNTKLKIVDADTATIIGTVFTDVNGSFSFQFLDNSESNGKNIYIIAEASSGHADITCSNGIIYTKVSDIHRGITKGIPTSINYSINMNDIAGQAFQILQAIATAENYVKAMEGSYLSSVDVIYPHNETGAGGCFYDRVEKTIGICTNLSSYSKNVYADWDVIMHEYGHHVELEMGIEDSPGGEHRWGGSLANSLYSKDKGIKLAWAEAYAYVFSGMAQQYFIANLQNIRDVGNASVETYNGKIFNYEGVDSLAYRKGDACEGSVIGLLWDLYDYSTNESYDTISLGHQTLWNLITSSNAVALSEFCEFFYDNQPFENELKLGALLSHYKVSIDDFTYTISNGNATFTWIANGTSSTYQNNRFDLEIYDQYGNLAWAERSLTTNICTIDSEYWELIIEAYEEELRVVIWAAQYDDPITGYYISETLVITN